MAKQYFVAKCDNITRLKDAMRTCIWACAERNIPPQPKDILSAAFDTSEVILVFSASNCKGWHGYASMQTKPGGVTSTEDDTTNMSMDMKEGKERDFHKHWYRFRIHWEVLYLKEHGEQCLPFTSTETMCCKDGNPLNKARNLQEIAPEVGKCLCDLIKEHYDSLSAVQERKKFAKLEKQPPPFLDTVVTQETDPQKLWSKLVGRVETLGTVLMACPFGSQRYNLHTPASDVDMFVVYAANTKDLLGFNSPPHTVKNREEEICDYTIHEIHRFCELVLAGDPRCVETLFLDPSTVYYASDAWKDLCQHRHQLLTRQCLEKYLRDATGSKGTKYVDKLEASGEANHKPVTPKLCKLFYVIIRLLQNARDIAHGEPLQVYRPAHTPDWETLMAVRKAKYSYQELRTIVDELLSEIGNLKSASPSNDCDENKTKADIEEWLINLRYKNFKEQMEPVS